jgi:hypothetical protein
MNSDQPIVAQPPQERWRALAELALPVWLAAWRLTWYSPTRLWRDWVFLISLYWIFSIFGRKTKAWVPVTASLSIALFAIYMIRQYDIIADTLRFCW